MRLHREDREKKRSGSGTKTTDMIASTLIFEKKIYPQFPQFIHPFLKTLLRNKKHLRKKVANFLLNEREMKLQRSILKSYPYSLVLDPTNICNLKCPLCPTWQDSAARPKGKMGIETVRRLLHEAGPYLFTVNLCNWGEPLLNPDLASIIREAKKYNTVVGLSTNLNYLPDGTEQALVESGIDILVVSLDGTTQESYSQYRRGGTLTTVLQNIERLNASRGGNKPDSPLLIWQFLVNRHNELEVEKARDMAENLGMWFFPSPMRTSMGKELLLPLYERVSEIQDWLPENPVYNKYAYTITPSTRTRQETCRWLWNSTVVNWDGSVSPCCGVFEKIWDFETCRFDQAGQKLTLHHAWNSPRYRMARRLVSGHMKKSENLDSLVRLAEEEGLICAKCIRYGFLEE